MKSTESLQLLLKLSIESIGQGRYHITALNEQQTIVPPVQLRSFFFYQNEDALYGLRNDIANDTTIIAHTSDCLHLYSKFRHPYVSWQGQTTADTQLLQAFEEAAHMEEQKIWQAVQFHEGQLSLDAVALNVAPTTADVLYDVVQEKLTQLTVQPEQLAHVITFLQAYGWPSFTMTHWPFQLALRLTEPSEGTSSWLLETVLVSERGTHWTPAQSKQLAPIEQALPMRWKPYAAEIQQQQTALIALLPTLENIQAPDHFLHLSLTDEQVRSFIGDDLLLCQSFNLSILLPTWLKEITETKLRVRTTIHTPNYQSTARLDEVLSFDWHFSLGDQTIDRETFQQIVDEQRTFIRTGNQWFHLDLQWLQQMKSLMEEAEKKAWTVKDLLFQNVPEIAAPIEETTETEDDPLLQFTIQQSLRRFVQQVAEKKELPSTPIPNGLQTTLHPYQITGYQWLTFMRDHQCGACLADDMGLGKTVQLIAYLLHIHETLQVDKPSLIICPTSVLGNWQKELQRFAPTLSVYPHYGSQRLKEVSFADRLQMEPPHVILTTYGTAVQDEKWLTAHHFASITIDEAQNIKNVQTKQSRAIRNLQGQHHIALTGTPIENKLAELWAIFDFIHRGFFGSFHTFTEQYIIPIERDQSEQTKHQLRLKIKPFLLRRTKNDQDLQLNLPRKLEENEYCPLTPEQAALYEGFLQESKNQLTVGNRFERQGVILKMLSRLKQLCNHPSLFLKEPLSPASELIHRSNKFKRIVMLTEEIVKNDEQCLIFTQYIGMGQLIRHCLFELYGIEVPFLTGSMKKNERDALVEAFQKGQFPVFLLSLKAGGTGLNLTNATHVLHADRWWNPAVENQATDRAYRIGQTKFVHVHKFITIGTIEEKIDEMLNKKVALSNELIQSSNWLTQLSDEELTNLFSFHQL